MDDLALPKPRLALLLHHFAEMKDEREPWRVVYPLREVLFLVVCATIANCDDYEDIADWAVIPSLAAPTLMTKLAMLLGAAGASGASARLPLPARGEGGSRLRFHHCRQSLLAGVFI